MEMNKNSAVVSVTAFFTCPHCGSVRLMHRESADIASPVVSVSLELEDGEVANTDYGKGAPEPHESESDCDLICADCDAGWEDIQHAYQEGALRVE